MSDTHPTPPESGAFNLDWRIARAFAHFAGAFWSGPTARRAWTLTLALAATLLLSTFITVQMNEWNRWFFDALERRDAPALWRAVLTFFVIVKSHERGLPWRTSGRKRGPLGMVNCGVVVNASGLNHGPVQPQLGL